MLMALVALATLAVCVMVRMLDFLFEQVEIGERHLDRVSEVSPLRGPLDPAVVSQIRTHPDVARVITQRELYIGVPLNTSGGLNVFGITGADMPLLMEVLGLRVSAGRLPRARANEIALSEEIAAVLDLHLGDPINRSIDERYYGDMPTTMVLVGILESEPAVERKQRVRLGLVSYEYLESHEVYASRPSSLIVVPRGGSKEAMDNFLQSSIEPPQAVVFTLDRLASEMAQGMLFFRLTFGIVDVVFAVVIALVVATINRLALSRRLEELGLLHAIGHSRRRLVRRLTLETAAVTMAGWLAGLALAWLLFAWLRDSVIGPCLELDLGRFTPVWFALPIPLFLVAFVGWSLARTLGRLDAVAVIEQGALAMETGEERPAVRHSLAKPLSAGAFYLRHRRRALVLAATMALMILGVAFPALLFTPVAFTNQVLYEHLRYVSVVSPRLGAALDPAVVAQIRTQPSIARAIPTLRASLMIGLPPLTQNSVDLYGVADDDLPGLLDLFGLQLEEGRLPEPRTNEIVVSRAIAMNRNLQVGDRVGRPVYEDDYGLPTEMVIAGILSRSPVLPGGDPWIGFASYEYLSSHEVYASQPARLLLVPAGGRKDEMDAWLEERVASEGTAVRTYRARAEDFREMTRVMLWTFGGIEGVVTVVASIALAVLGYVFFSQRRDEFGVLHAIGHSRRWLVRRTVGETVSVVTVAWLIGAVVCLAALVYLRTALFAPRGLTLNLFHPGSWLLTLPVPLAVVAVSTGLVVWMLSTLDPVSIIERRS